MVPLLCGETGVSSSLATPSPLDVSPSVYTHDIPVSFLPFCFFFPRSSSSNCLIDPSLILPLALIMVDLTLQISLIAPLISMKRLLWRSRLLFNLPVSVLVPSPIMMVSLMRTSWTVALVLVDLVFMFGFPHLCLPLLPLLRLQNLYVPNEHLCITLRLLSPLPLLICLVLVPGHRSRLLRLFLGLELSRAPLLPLFLFLFCLLFRSSLNPQVLLLLH